ncbi:unnamed protein product [Protopolystoma xenopodis]|uniref:Uncharacterized protein n=1 Tax=Protopolystoma xenopodis TaxID=117903 RepID=A0A3S5BPI8_9PLAT|nr:unnamed protein product [Protopolystoma xenopodis]
MKDEWDRQQILATKSGLLMERQTERARRELNQRLAEENLKLAQHQKCIQEYLNKEVNDKIC